MTPILFRVLDLVEGRFRKDYTPALDQIAGDALTLWDKKNGRTDAPVRVPVRDLVVATEDTERAKALGAICIDGVWQVPEGEDLDKFEMFWPPVAPDLLDRKERGLRTKDGQPIEGHRLIEDGVRGQDSTATPLMYAALPMVAALAFALTNMGFATLGMASLALALPFLITIAQHEGAGEGLKSSLIWLLLPYFLSANADKLEGVLKPQALLGNLMTLGIVFGAMVVLTGFLAFVTSTTAQADSRFVSRWITNIKWTAFSLGVVGACATLLPAELFPIAAFVLAGMAPMFHAEKNYNTRAKLMAVQGLRFNLGTSGPLANAHIEPRRRQALNAHNDKTAFIEIGVAKGWLTEKHYPYSPDEGTTMGASALDLSMHLVVLGMIGMGKTEGVMRGVAKQWCEQNAGGLVVMCGKGSLPGELSALIDLMIAPGVDFAPIQGMNAQAVAFALNSIRMEDAKKDIWDGGAMTYVEHLTVLHQALRDHEMTWINHAKNVVRAKEGHADGLRVQIGIAEKAGREDEAQELRKRLETTKGQIAAWSLKRDARRQWLWNIDTLHRLKIITNTFTTAGGKDTAGPEVLDIVHYLGHWHPMAVKDNDGASMQTAIKAENDFRERLEKHPESIHPRLGKGSSLDAALVYFLKEWPTTVDTQRKSFLLNVEERLNPLIRGDLLVNARGVNWKMLENGEDISCALRGKRVGFDLPETEHGRASVAIVALAKQRLYVDIQKRARKKNWREEGETPVLFMIDEMHRIVGKQEADLASISRSLGLSFVCATQTIESLRDQLRDENAAVLLLNQFQSFVTLKTSPRTYEYLEQRLGTATIVRFPRPVAGIDYYGALQTFAKSSLNDMDSPYASAMQKLNVMGAGRARVPVPGSRMLMRGFGSWQGHRTLQVDDDTMDDDFLASIGGAMEVRPLVEPEEWSALLTGPGEALVYLNRAGAPRVDFVTLPRVKPDDCRA